MAETLRKNYVMHPLVSCVFFLGPVGHEAPAYEHDLFGALGDDHRHHLPGGDIITRDYGIETSADLEWLVEGFSRLEGETSANGNVLYAMYRVGRPRSAPPLRASARGLGIGIRQPLRVYSMPWCEPSMLRV
jgi:hypothetical protein